MALAKLSKAQATSINLARTHSSDKDRKAVKAEIFKLAKETFGIPADIKLRVETEDHTKDNFLVLRNAADDAPFELGVDGRWLHAEPSSTIEVGVRWFALPRDRAAEALTDDVLYGDDTQPQFEAGSTAPPSGSMFCGDSIAVNGDQVFVRIPETAF